MGRTSDPLAALASLPGVPEAVDSARQAVDQIYGHRVMRRRSSEAAAEAALRGARASAALAGADWPLEEVRRRGDYGAGDGAATVGAALRLTAEAGQLLDVWRQSPVRVLARLHLVAAAGAVPEETLGRPRRSGEDDQGAGSGSGELAGVPLPEPSEVSARLEGLAELLIAGSEAPALVVAAVVHGELLALRPFGSYNGLVARVAQRIVLVGGGLDPKSVCPVEVGHAEVGPGGYRKALEAYLTGTREGLADWIGHCAKAIRLGVRESTAVCEALQRGAA